LIMKRDEMESVEDIVALIEKITYRYFGVMKELHGRELPS